MQSNRSSKLKHFKVSDIWNLQPWIPLNQHQQHILYNNDNNNLYLYSTFQDSCYKVLQAPL